MPLPPKDWPRVDDVFEGARALPVEKRPAYLAERCSDDEALRQEVESLLAWDARAESSFETPLLVRVDDAIVMKTLEGQRIGPYQLSSKIGAGGMGEVYKARDTRLDRTVAIKVLTAHLADDPHARERFQREARAVAALNHPHICTLHDVGSQDLSAGSGQTMDFLVMEYLDGETLAERLVKGPLPLDQALQYAIQIADALDKAHRRGITHRDLKPANVMLTTLGTKLLDFGLAKLRPPMGAVVGMSDAPTISPSLTGRGTILGTLQYMAPEQLEGKPADARTDVFAFGAVLYEMLTGKKAFEGTSPASLIAAILSPGPPPIALQQPLIPPALDRVVTKCLAKDPDERWQSTHDLTSELQWIAESGVRIDIVRALADPAAQTAATGAARTSRVAWLVAAVATVAVVGLSMPTIRYLRETPTPSRPEMRVEINPPAQSAPLEFSLSPDGRHIVFVASADGRRRLWLRALNKMDAQAMTGTDGARYPFWSADSRSIGYFASRKLYRIDVGGGPPQELADIPVTRGGTWNADGTIVFGPTDDGPLMRIARPGDEPRAVTHLDPGQTGHRWPQFLPDGRHFLFLADGTTSASGIYLGSLDGGAAKRLMASAVAAAYLEPNLVFVQQGALVARHLDVARGELTGDSMTLADAVGYDVGFKLGAFSVSADGHVAYQTRILKRDELFWADRTGAASRVAVNVPDVNRLVFPDLSPNGRTVAVELDSQSNFDIWLIDLAGRGGSTRFTFDAAIDAYPRWSPDGSQIVFSSARLGSPKLYLKASNGAPGSERLLLEKAPAFPEDWSGDGRFLLYMVYDPQTGRDLWAVDMNEKKLTPRPFVNTSFDERNGQFSPDGHWLAYQTNESGRHEVVVVSFPDPTERRNVSTSGGAQPRWRSDGKELYFVAPDGRLMAAPITIARQAHGSRIEVGAPVSLFQTLMVGDGASTVTTRYAVSRDGRFLISQPAESATTPITLILNWKPPASEIIR